MVSSFIENIDSANKKIKLVFEQFRIINPILRKIVSVLFFIVVIHCFYSYVGVYKFIERRPCSTHSWAQCQRASIAQCYYQEDMNFFKPRVQNYTEKGGVTGVEFPIIYYTAALLYKMFGFHEMYLRVISLVLLSCGLFLFYLLADRYLKNLVLSIMIVGSAVLSPVLLYYAPNFLPDAPSLGMVLAAWFFLFRYLKTNSKTPLNLFILLGTIAALIKVVSVICFVVVICLIVLDRMKLFRKENRIYLFYTPTKVFIRICVGCLLVVGWYVYAKWLSIAYQNETFCLQVVTGNSEVLTQLIDKLKRETLFYYYSYESYVLIIGALFTLIIGYKFINRILLAITLLYLVGSICYVYFFLPQFINHDYYTISILPFVFFLFITFADIVSKFSEKYFIGLKFIFFIIIFFNMKECLIKCKKFYHSRYDINYYYTLDERSYYDLEPRLRAAGIKREDPVLSVFDDTFCNTTYLMNQIGTTLSSLATGEQIKSSLMKQHVKYLILNDSARFNALYPNNLEKNILLTHRGLIVYKLR